MTDISPSLKLYRKRMSFYIDLLGGKCKMCGSSHSLEFDHIDPSTKYFAISDAITRCYPVEVLLNELEKCQLLCDVCHLKKTLDENGRAEHGGWAMYKHHGCRCAPCVDFHRTYFREYAKRKAA